MDWTAPRSLGVQRTGHGYMPLPTRGEGGAGEGLLLTSPDRCGAKVSAEVAGWFGLLPGLWGFSRTACSLGEIQK